MGTETVLDNPFITIWYHQDKRIVHHQWHKFIQGEELHKALLAGTELLKKNKAIRWLSDDRNYPVMTPEDATWAQTVWFPETVKAGWKHWAIVLPETPVGKLNIKAFIQKYAEAGINALIFTDPDEALKWLASQ